MIPRTLDDLDFSGKPVLVRADLNLPLIDGAVGDPARLKAAVPTIREILRRGGKPVIISHLGRPKGKPDPALSLRPFAPALSAALQGTPVRFAANCIGEPARSVVEGLQPGEVALLENLRFHPEEAANDPAFAAALAALAACYVDDAFSTAHRAHASIVGLPRLLPAAAGLLMQRELAHLEEHLGNPKRPMAAILGGAKVSSKIGVLRALAHRVDSLILGGGMANTFLAARGIDIGRSFHEKDAAPLAADIERAAAAAGCSLLLPTDVVVSESRAAHARAETTSLADIPANGMILDLGPDSVARICAGLRRVRTVVWNGPLGVAELPGFERATHAVAAFIAKRTREGALVSVAGGGETAAALVAAGVADAFSYVSLGGGAFLEWLQGKTLPGIAALASGGGPQAQTGTAG